jgi:hypothetical protein
MEAKYVDYQHNLLLVDGMSYACSLKPEGVILALN